MLRLRGRPSFRISPGGTWPFAPYWIADRTERPDAPSSRVPGKVLDQLGIAFHWRELLETVGRRRLGPGQRLARVSLDERRKTFCIIEHRRTNVHELVEPLRPREQPAHAMRAEEVP